MEGKQKKQALQKQSLQKQVLGWREWASLPELNIPAIAVKVDTGARTSSIHAFHIRPFVQDGQIFVRFIIHPLQKKKKPCICCTLPLKYKKTIRSSNGIAEERYIVSTVIEIGEKRWPIDLSLANRDVMSYRMLLGREAMSHILVDPKKSFLQGHLDHQTIEARYQICETGLV